MTRLGNLGSLLGLLFVVQTLADPNATSTTETGKSLPQQPECARVQDYFVRLKIGHANLVPKNKVHDPEMEICYKGDDDKFSDKQTCCTRRMERKFTTSTEKDFYEVIRSTSSYLKNLISSNSAQYQEQFLNMIREAENNTETLFSEIYKMPLKDRRAPIENLFMDLQAFIKHKEVNIHESVAQFFDELFPLVFHNILNDPTLTTLNEDYKECLMEIRQQVNPHPFGDNPNKIGHHLSKSLTVARSFLQALALGIEAINTTDYIPLESHCTKAMTRFQHCSACEGYVAARPCKNYCLNVMRGCLATVSQLDSHWNAFVDAVEKLTAHMKGPYSIEDVLHALDKEISAAIMHAMETGHKFYAKVVAKCGHPKTTKAAPNAGPLHKHPPPRSDSLKPEVKLQSRISNLMRSLSSSKGFYSNLPDTMCNTAKFSSGSTDRCWNGHDTHRYSKNVTEFSLAAQLNHNPEMHIAQTRASVLTTLTDKLIHITKLLESKSTSDGEQADSWGSHNKKYTRYYGSGDGTQSDDEDEDDYDGSGSGREGSGGYYPARPGRRGNGNDDHDIYIEGGGEKVQLEPTIIVKEARDKHSGATTTSAPYSYSYHFLLSLISIALWLNG